MMFLYDKNKLFFFCVKGCSEAAICVCLHFVLFVLSVNLAYCFSECLPQDVSHRNENCTPLIIVVVVISYYM